MTDPVMPQGVEHKKVAFLFPGSGPYEALDGWVGVLKRHAQRHQSFLFRTAAECAGFTGPVFVLTEARTYPRERIDADLVALRTQGTPFAVVHNHDNPPVPSLGHYPSFCWTKAGWRRLTAHGFNPFLLRQPVFPALVPPAKPGKSPLVATFGSVEYKKGTLEMARWARKHNVPFLALGPRELAEDYLDYVRVVRNTGAGVSLYPWAERVEDLAAYMTDVTHFLFVLPPAKGGSGGSPTSPRYATMFNRAVLVVDDEDTYAQDGFHVYQRLEDIPSSALGDLELPRYDWGPDAYLGALCEKTLAFWGE